MQNPLPDTTTLVSGAGMNGTLEARDALGKLVIVRRVQGSSMISISDLPPGTYRARSIGVNGGICTLSFARDH